MPTANPKTGSVKTTTSLSRGSNGTLELVSSSMLSTNNNNESLRRSMVRRQSRAMETRESDLKIKKEKSYGKLTKTYEYRRRANLAKAREMAVKMENYKNNRELPLATLASLAATAQQSANARRTGGGGGGGGVPLSQSARNIENAKRSATSARSMREEYTGIERKTAKSIDYKSASRTFRRNAGGGLINFPYRLKENVNPHHVVVEPHQQRTPRHKHVECQTSASEMKNWQVPSADCKIMQPSPALWQAILKKRDDDLKRAMLKEERYVPEYSKSEVNYQTNLKEFLETGVVRHYDRDFDNQREEKLKPKSTKSDDLRRALKYRPRVQPEMDLKKRLPKIEEELLRAFKGRP